MRDDLGTLDATGPTLVFTRVYDHPIERVWAAVAEPEHQAVWFPQQIVGTRRAGEPLRFLVGTGPDDGFDGSMIAYEPPHLIEMWWGTSRLRIELEAVEGGTRLTLAETLDDVGGGARNGAGWHECIDRLGAVVRGTTPERWGVRWREVHPDYVVAFGPEADVAKAPEGWDRDLPEDPWAPRFPRAAT